jgi:predicted PurR-regulated permease PerM
VLLSSLVLLGGMLALVAPPAVDEFGKLDVSVSETLDEVQRWIRQSPLPVSSDQLSNTIQQLEDQLRSSLDVIAGQVVGGALLAFEVSASLALAVVVLFFVLKDGRRILVWTVGFLPESRRDTAERMGAKAWQALGGFVRGQTLVALFDALLIGLAHVLVGVPLALPLAVLTFFGAYVPVIGATVTGLLAVLIALVAEGAAAAAAVLAAIVLVQHIEGNVFQPVVVGQAIDVHPRAILLAVAAGGVLGGIIGAMVAAPAVAVGAAVLRDIRDGATVEREPTTRDGR